MKSANQTTIDTIKASMGQHPQDIAGMINESAKTLSWLAELATVIKEQAFIGTAAAHCRIGKIAGVIEYLGHDAANSFGCYGEDVIDSLIKAGLIEPEAG
ncbi:MAG: hypothetical protein PHV02_14075 [Rhodocyclaceae bacterium]|nr:hypothetical protein [Rhodocyclaceae bacterium]